MPRALKAGLVLLTLILGGGAGPEVLRRATQARRGRAWQPEPPPPCARRLPPRLRPPVGTSSGSSSLEPPWSQSLPSSRAGWRASRCSSGTGSPRGPSWRGWTCCPCARELAIAQAVLQAARAQEQVSTVTLQEAQDRVRRNETPGLVIPPGHLGGGARRRAPRRKIASARLGAAQAQVQEQLARVEQMQQRLADATLTAPFAGMVAARYLDPGLLTSPSRPILRLLGAGEQKVRFAIPENEVHKVSLGIPVRVRLLPRTPCSRARWRASRPRWMPPRG